MGRLNSVLEKGSLVCVLQASGNSPEALASQKDESQLSEEGCDMGCTGKVMSRVGLRRD